MINLFKSFFIFIIIYCNPVFAESILPLNPQVEYVVTNGNWTNKEERGTYRVVSFVGGYEHIHNNIVAEWIQYPKKQSDLYEVVRSETLINIYLLRFNQPKLTQIEDRVRVDLEGVFNTNIDKEVSCGFMLYPTGIIEELKTCITAKDTE